jgi:hypothetical protein
MTAVVEEILRRIESLSPEELHEFRVCYHEFDAQAWDEQIATDASSGRLDALANLVLAGYESGRATPL